jgi:hypothetical protein
MFEIRCPRCGLLVYAGPNRFAGVQVCKRCAAPSGHLIAGMNGGHPNGRRPGRDSKVKVGGRQAHGR